MGIRVRLELIFLTISLLSFCSLGNFAQAEAPLTGVNPSQKSFPFVSFLEKTILNVPATRDIKVGDLNGDGSADLIFLTPTPEVFWTSLGDGKGNFAPPQRHGFAPSYSNVVIGTTFIMGDFDGDGRDEVLHFQRRHIRSETKEAMLFLVSSDMDDKGIFQDNLLLPLPDTLITSHDQLFLFSRDIDGDNRTDFILGDKFLNEFFVLKNTPDLWNSPSLDFNLDNLTQIDVGVKIPNKKRYHQVLMLDIDNDGITDLIKVGKNEIFIMRGDKNKIFIKSRKALRPTFFIQSQGLSLGLNPTIIYGYLNRDVFPDLLLINDWGKGWILLNREGKDFTFFIPLDLPHISLIKTGDFNGDGIDDLVTYGDGYQNLKLLLNNGEGYFHKIIEQPAGGTKVSNLAVHDINHDGLSDIILTVYNPTQGLEGRILLNISQRVNH